MPTNDPDTPLLPRAEQIRRREFATVRRGYDPEQIRTYLTSIADQVETLEREVSQLRLEASSAAARGEPVSTTLDPASPTENPYDALSKRFAALIELADQEAEKLAERRRNLVTQLEEMHGKLIAVAEALAVSVDEAVRVANETELAVVSVDEIDQETETSIDPRYESFWAKREEPLQVPDLARLDPNLKERDE